MTWIDRYYSKTRSPFAELARHFFLGLFHPESTAGEDSFTAWLVQVLAALIAASWFLPVQLFRRYADLHALAGPQAMTSRAHRGASLRISARHAHACRIR